MAAVLALVATPLGNPVVAGFTIAVEVIEALAVSGAHKMFHAGFLSRKLLLEPCEAYGFLAHDSPIANQNLHV